MNRLESLAEFIEVAQRPKFQKYFSPADIAELLSYFQAFGELIHVVSKVQKSRDPKDDFRLALVKGGQAQYLVTGDNDLLEQVEFEGCKIVTY